MSDQTVPTLPADVQPLRVALFGCGIIAENHAAAIALLEDVTIVALIDAVPLVAEALADRIAANETGTSEPGANETARPATFETLADALDATSIDLVVVCVPSGLHVAAAEQALAAGAHVLIEKPLDVSLPRARRIAQLADDAAARGLVVSVVSQHRFDPASVAVRQAIDAGEFGRLTSGLASIAWWREQAYYDSAQWRGTWELDGGGAAMNQGIHTIDLLLWLLGAPVEVSARTANLAHERIEVEDTLVATVTFESGALGVIHATTAAYPEVGARLQIHGSRGSAVIERDQLHYFQTEAGAEPPTPQPDDDAFVLGHLRQYRDVVSAIRDHRQPGVSVADALLALTVIRALYLSQTLGRAVTIAEVADGSLDDVVVATGGAA